MNKQRRLCVHTTLKPNHLANGAMMEKVFLPRLASVNSLVFLRTTKNEACALANERALPVRYMIDCATRSLLVVPDKQMEDFRRVLDFSLEEGGLVEEPLCLGDRVRVIKGVLCGVEGYVVELHGKTYVVVRLLESIFAKARIPRSWLEKI